jgi:hypothetical protein
MQTAIDIAKRHESVLNTTNRTVGSAETEQEKELLTISKARITSILMYLKEEDQKIKKFEEEQRTNATTLQQLYARLEEEMKASGLHPNTVKQRIEELRSQEEKARAARKANIAIRNTERDQSQSDSSIDQTKKSAPTVDPKSKATLKEPPIADKEFLERFLEDLRSARKSVIIMSKYLSVEQTSKIMPELARLASRRLNILIYTERPEDQTELMKLESLNVIAIAHRHMITVIMRPNIENNAAIIDDLIAWEGSINILGPSRPQTSMHRVVGSHNARNLRKYISAKPF